jgi:hypothetical protein
MGIRAPAQTVFLRQATIPHANRSKALPADRQSSLHHLQPSSPLTRFRISRSQGHPPPGSRATPQLPPLLSHRLRPDAGAHPSPHQRTGKRDFRYLPSRHQTRILKALEGPLDHLWQPRDFDFKAFSETKHIDKIRYIHRNPVTGGLVPKPEAYPRNSFNHYATGEPSAVEIESHWTTVPEK